MISPCEHPLLFVTLAGVVACASVIAGSQREEPAAEPALKLITLDPGHFHAALIQKEMYPGVSDVVHVFAPLGPDLIAHLNRIAQFNLRAANPTRWRLEIHTGPEPLERMLQDRPGDVVILSGRNQVKIDRILASVKAGLNVLADKPWIIASADLPKLEAALDAAEQNGLVAYDVMTERHEITNVLQRELLGDAAIAGPIVTGTEEEPAVYMDSVHHLLKTVAGVPNLRPAWFFDTTQAGEGLADVGTHLADLVPWMLFPNEVIDYRTDIRLLSATRWPTVITQAEFARVTGEKDVPAFLGAHVRDGKLHYDCNTEVSYTLRGIHTRLKVVWDYEASPGAGDAHLSIVRGSQARIEVRQGAEQEYRPELYVVPAGHDRRTAVTAALKARVAQLQSRYPGIAVEETSAGLRVIIPDRYRTGHESHFAEVTHSFLGYLREPKTLPPWEKPNMLAKYYVTTGGVDLSRQRTGLTR